MLKPTLMMGCCPFSLFLLIWCPCQCQLTVFKCHGFRYNYCFIDRVNNVTKTLSLCLYALTSTCYQQFKIFLTVSLLFVICLIYSVSPSSSEPLTCLISPLVRCLMSFCRGPAAPWFSHHRHGPTVKSGGANTHCHHALCRQWQPRPRHLLVQRLPPCQHHQQQWTH